MSAPSLTWVSPIDVFLGITIVVNAVLAAMDSDWLRVFAWVVAGLCLAQACMWHNTANTWEALARGGHRDRT